MLPRSLYFLLALGIVSAVVQPVLGDDKDLLKGGGSGAPPNLLIVFGNSKTMTQTLSFTGVNTSTFDGDADSPGSKMGAAKRVIKQFVADRHGTYNIGLTGFARTAAVNAVSITQKHWVYAPLTVDFPGETWAEPIGTLERWGVKGEGPCTNQTVPVCSDRSPVLNLPNGATIDPENTHFFGPQGAGTVYIYLDLVNPTKAGGESNSTKRIKLTLLTTGKYGDAFTDGTLSTYRIAGSPPHSMEVKKEYQTKSGSTWMPQKTAPAVPYVALGSPIPASSGSLDPTLFYPTGALDGSGNSIAGSAIGFLSDPQHDFDVNATCGGWEFQANNAQLPLVKIPRDYLTPDPNNPSVCLPAQDSLPCVNRMLRPQAYVETYDRTTGLFNTVDPDNPGYTGFGSKDADGCDKALRGSVDAGLDSVPRNILLESINSLAQAPILTLLTNIYDYFTKPSIDGFTNGVRGDDPNASCRNDAVILVYDTFNACDNSNCGFLTNKILTPLKQIGVPVYVIGFGANAAATANTGVCIAHNSGAILPDGSDGYFPVTSAAGLYQALNDIAAFVLEGQKGFVASTISTAQAAGDQMVYLATFNAASERSIWNGRVNGYKLDANGKLQLGTRTIKDTNDPFTGAVLAAPSNDPSSLIWNAGQNLAQTPGTGATVSSAVLAPNAAKTNGTYSDDSNDTVTTIATTRYPGRKIVFSLPQGYANPVTLLPIPPGASVPEIRNDMTASTGASWWPAVKALLGPQTAQPGAPAPLADTDATDSLRFIWGDRDAVMGAAASSATQKYTPPNSSYQLKLGDIFHASPVLIGAPNDFASFASNLHDYQTFRNTYQHRRRVLFFGANDGLFHAVDAGGWDRTLSVCVNPDGTQGDCYDLGTGAELFAYSPRATMQAFKPLKDAVGAQTKRDEWTVDGAPTAADVFIDSVNTGVGTPAERAWHTVIVGGVREGSPFEGTSGSAPTNSLGSYYALDVTQPDQLVPDGAGGFSAPVPTSFNAPKCLNVSGDASCARDWPQVLWEISDVGDLDVSGSPGFGYGDMGESWSKPAVGRVRVCTANCGNTSAPFPVTEDRYVAIFGGGFDRERLNRRGNWIYMIDIETGHVLYRANSSCGINSGAGCSPTYFASIPSEPAALDTSGDGILDVVYFGDQKGQLWRIDLSDLQITSSPASRWQSQVNPSAGSATPFLIFKAPQPVAPAVDPFYPVYYRPTAVYLGYNVNGKAALGLAFGTGDRDDILSKYFPGSLNFSQRFYYVIDKANTTTRTESDLYDITSATAASTTTVPPNGWFIELAKGERVISDSVSINGVIYFPTFNPNTAATGSGTCANSNKCLSSGGSARLYRVYYSTGNPYIGSDRGETQPYGGFLSEPVYFQSKDQQGNIFYTTENTVKTENAPGGKKTSVKGWKERSRRP
jgi:Tfp pilus tip-associated adhesin PilY1